MRNPLPICPKELTEANIVLKLLESAKKMHPGFIDGDLHKIAYEQQKKGYFMMTHMCPSFNAAWQMISQKSTA